MSSVFRLFDLVECGLAQREESEQGDPVYRILHPAIASLALEGSGAEGGDAVTELVEGDHAAGDRGRHDCQLLLAETDR